MNKSDVPRFVLILNVVGAVACVACWVGDMGWGFAAAAVFFLLGGITTALWFNRDESGSFGISDYLVSSFGWHLAVLSALGFGGWKLMVVGLGIGGIMLVGLIASEVGDNEEEGENEREAATDPDATLPVSGRSTFEQELERIEEGKSASPEPAHVECGPFQGLVDHLRATGDPTPGGIDWNRSTEQHLGKVVNAVGYAGFIEGWLRDWPARAHGDSGAVERYHRRASMVGHLIWEWEKDVEVASCSNLFISTLAFISNDPEGFKPVFIKAIEMCAMEDGQFRTATGRISFAVDLLQIVEGFWNQGMEELKEKFPMGDGVDGVAAEDDLHSYFKARIRAEEFVLEFIRNARIDPSQIDAGLVSGVLDGLLPQSREAFVERWCGVAGFK